MQEFILNWVTQVRAKRLGPFLVGALDDGAAQLCESRGIPAVSFGALACSPANHCRPLQSLTLLPTCAQAR